MLKQDEIAPKSVLGLLMKACVSGGHAGETCCNLSWWHSTMLEVLLGKDKGVSGVLKLIIDVGYELHGSTEG